MSDAKNEPMNRRDFFKAGRGWLGNALVSVTEAASEAVEQVGQSPRNSLFDKNRGLLRPPGAVAEADFIALCAKCDDCIVACPEDVLFAAPPEAGTAAGTPIFNPAHKACFLCSDLHCIVACREGALLRPATMSAIAIGSARIHPALCRAFEDEDCHACVDACPLPKGVAITRVDNHPHINPGLCVGCGLCEYYCAHNAYRHAIVTSSLRQTFSPDQSSANR